MTSLSDNQWKVAHAIAQQLVLNEADANELGKAIAYLRAFGDKPDAGKGFFKYLQTLSNNGRTIGHSGKTSGYYQTISKVCNESLRQYQEDPAAMQEILGWGFRLMRYYKNAVPTGELNAIATQSAAEPIVSERQAEIAEVLQAQTFQIGQQLEAKVTAIKGNKVTYEILGTIKLTQKEPKNFKILSESQTVTASITELREDGSIKKVNLED
ncbi:hypothetical protein [Laspinema olomoucense]|uniref:Uncharacterized protein n=1 Tax=Laspinema olomoucense D3b TaxID=2953688 RepID=A0ABT2N992_9CYAN|nr:MULTISPECIES: hypothetical protein [unclassified Laspinema]MCT7971064.1 hypothetical protein [Laspinema sp. D3d]MCT7979021.1 hypothetical protein [Laspinema sp. D3b]